MMLKWLNKQGVASDDGYEVQCTGRFTCDYSEGGVTLQVGVERGRLDGKPCLIVARSAFVGWTGPLVGGETREGQQDRLMRNFREALQFQGYELDLVS
jgi:hypothetical protein